VPASKRFLFFSSSYFDHYSGSLLPHDDAAFSQRYQAETVISNRETEPAATFLFSGCFHFHFSYFHLIIIIIVIQIDAMIAVQFGILITG